MPIPGTVPVTGPVAPTSTSDTYPAHDEQYGLGGFRSVDTTTDRDAIPSGRRNSGMRVYVRNTGITYVLGPALTNGSWTVDNRGQQVVDTVSALAALPGATIPNGTEFYVRCYATIGDGGEGSFWFDNTSAATAVPGMVIAPASGTGRFFRKYNGEVNVKWFGARGDYITDDTAALQAAITFAEAPTYGAQYYTTTFANNSAISVYIPAGSYTTSSTLTFTACEIYGKAGGDQSFFNQTVIHCKHGGHCFTWLSDPTNFRVGSLHDICGLGYSETYQQNKIAITSVTSRTVFDVDPANSPSTFSGHSNICFFFDNEGTFLGHGVIGSVNTGTGQVTLLTGTDSYATVTGAGGFLTTTCKVVFTPTIANEVGITNFLDPASAGSCFLWMKDTHPSATAKLPHVYNVIAKQFHCGIRLPPGGLGGMMRNLQLIFMRFAATCVPVAARSADTFWTDCYFSGYYYADYLRTPSNSHDNKVFRQAGYCVYNPGSLDRYQNLLCEYACYAGIYSDRVLSHYFSHVTIDGCTRYAVVARTAYASPLSSSPWMEFSQLVIRTSFSSDNQNTVHANKAAIYIIGETPTNTARPVRITVGQLAIVTGGGTPFDGTFNIDATATVVDHRVRVNQYVDQGGTLATIIAGSQQPEILDSRWSTSPSDVRVGQYFPARNSTAEWDVAVADAKGLALKNTGLEVISATGTTPLRITRSDTSKSWDFNISTDILRAYNTTAGYYGWDVQATQSLSALTIGLNGSQNNPRSCTVQAESVGSIAAKSCTITIDSPGVVTATAHGLVANDQIVFATTGSLPTGITAATVYYVISTGLTANDFQFSATLAGAAVNTSGSQSGTHTVQHVNAPSTAFLLISARGSGNDASGGSFDLYTPDIGSSGATTQSTSRKWKFSRYGHILFSGQSSDSAADVTDGAFYYQTTAGKFRSLANSKWGNLDRWAVTITNTTTVTVGAKDELITTNNAGAVTVNLPAGILNQRYAFKNVGAGTATLTPNGSEKLFTTAQVSTLALATGDYKLIQWDGTQWLVL